MVDAAERILPVVLCGGQGSRLWPLSRSGRPKQFLPLVGDESLFQQTLTRVGDRERFVGPIVVTNESYRFLTAEQAQEADQDLSAILLEPVPRNTAAAIVAAAVFAVEKLGSPRDQLILVLPSDHRIIIDDSYWASLGAGSTAARDGWVVTFGIVPTDPATRFGYIQQGAEIVPGAHRVGSFVEKPPLKEAERMLEAGGYLWNSGMFLFRADVLMQEAGRLLPEVVNAARLSVGDARSDLDFVRLAEDAFSKSPNISIDHGILEHTDSAAVVPAGFSWSDLGSWDAVWQIAEKDCSQNVARGPALFSNTASSLVVTESTHVTLDGLEDVAVIVSADAVFVGRLSAAQNVGNLVKLLAADSETATLTEEHLTSYRPWGGYTSLLKRDRFQVKRLFVKPGKRLSCNDIIIGQSIG